MPCDSSPMVSSRWNITRLRFPLNAWPGFCDWVVLGNGRRWTGLLGTRDRHSSILCGGLGYGACSSSRVWNSFRESASIHAGSRYLHRDVFGQCLGITWLLSAFHRYLSKLRLCFCYCTHPPDRGRYRNSLGPCNVIILLDDHGYRFELGQCLRLLLNARFDNCSCVVIRNGACLRFWTRILRTSN